MKTKIFTAHYRYREEGSIGPLDHYVELNCTSLKEAKKLAKGLEDRDDRMTWLMGVERKEV